MTNTERDVVASLGHMIARRVFALYCVGDKIRAGRLFACSWPAWGLKSIHTASPRSGIYEGSVAMTLPNLFAYNVACVSLVMQVFRRYAC